MSILDFLDSVPTFNVQVWNRRRITAKYTVVMRENESARITHHVLAPSKYDHDRENGQGSMECIETIRCVRQGTPVAAAT